MTYELAEARLVIRDEAATWHQHVMAAMELSTNPEATGEDLRCCRRYPGLPTEMADMEFALRARRAERATSLPATRLTE